MAGQLACPHLFHFGKTRKAGTPFQKYIFFSVALARV
jgi:hypothetical protein